MSYRNELIERIEKIAKKIERGEYMKRREIDGTAEELYEFENGYKKVFIKLSFKNNGNYFHPPFSYYYKNFCKEWEIEDINSEGLIEISIQNFNFLDFAISFAHEDSHRKLYEIGEFRNYMKRKNEKFEEEAKVFLDIYLTIKEILNELKEYVNKENKCKNDISNFYKINPINVLNEEHSIIGEFLIIFHYSKGKEAIKYVEKRIESRKFDIPIYSLAIKDLMESKVGKLINEFRKNPDEILRKRIIEELERKREEIIEILKNKCKREIKKFLEVQLYS
jgi:hypothetical protein